MSEGNPTTRVPDLSAALEDAAIAADLEVFRLDQQSIACYVPAPLVFLGVAGPSVSYSGLRMSQSSKFLRQVLRQRRIPYAEAEPDKTAPVVVMGSSITVDESIGEESADRARQLAQDTILSLPGAVYGCVSLTSVAGELAVSAVDVTFANWAESASDSEIEHVARGILDIELIKATGKAEV